MYGQIVGYRIGFPVLTCRAEAVSREHNIHKVYVYVISLQYRSDRLQVDFWHLEWIMALHI
jgi:hypothetical protein